MWSEDRLSQIAVYAETERAYVQQVGIDETVGGSATHTLSVNADAGASQPWEGSAGDVNTGNGNKLTSLNLLSWKVRGGMSLDFTLFHNSQSNYDDELGHGWTWTYDVYVNASNPTAPILHWGDGTSIPYSGSGSTYTAPAGIYDSLVKNVDNTWTVTKKDGTKFKLNAAGFLKRVEDMNGNAIVLTLNSANYVTKITDPTGRYVDVNLDSNNEITSVEDSTGREWTISQNLSSDLTSVAWPILGSTVYTDGFAYSSHRITTQTDRRGKTSFYSYNTDGSLASETDPLSHTTSYGYGSSASTITNALGKVTTHHYAAGKLVSVVDSSGYSTSYLLRDGQNNPISVMDQRGKTWSQTYDSKGNQLTRTDPLGKTTTSTYNVLSQLVTFSDQLGHTTTKTYDVQGNLLTVVNALGKVVQSNTVGLYGLISSSVDALGKSTNITYDSDGNVATICDATSVQTNLSYDSLSRATGTTDNLGATTTRIYDAWGRLVQTIRPITSGSVGASVYKTYLPTGEISSSTDELGHITIYIYDDARRLTSVTNARGDVESYGYDAANRKTTVINGRGKISSYTFTNRGDVATFTMPDGATEKWYYDGSGTTTAYENALGQTTFYNYDDAGHHTLTDYPTGVDSNFNYDFAGRMTSMVDSTGTTTWAYNAANQEVIFTSPQGGQTSAYDDAGHRTSLTGTGIARTWTYDDAGRPLSIANESGETTNFVYDSIGRLIKRNDNNLITTYGYDARGRTTSVGTVTVPAQGSYYVSNETCTYDAAGNVTYRTLDAIATTYTYDLADQLLSESWVDAQHSTSGSRSYTYDANGNRTSKTDGGITQTYSIDDGDKLTAITQGGTTVKSYGYDAAGRTTSVTSSAGTTTLGYDYESRVTGITYPGSSTNSFTYNGLDTRVGKADSAGTTAYRRDGADVTSDVLSAGGTVFTPGISQRTAGATTMYVPDHLGTSVRQTNFWGNTSAIATYDAFGNRTNTSGTHKGPFGFAGGYGYQEDGDSGLKLLGHRYYDSSTGRFLTRDKSKDGRNWYAYCANNPLKAVDADGQAWIVIAVDERGLGHVWIMIVWDNGDVWILQNTMFANNELITSLTAGGRADLSTFNGRAEAEYWQYFDENKIDRSDVLQAFQKQPDEYNLATNNCVDFATNLLFDLMGGEHMSSDTPYALMWDIISANLLHDKGRRPPKSGKVGTVPIPKPGTPPKRIGGGGRPH